MFSNVVFINKQRPVCQKRMSVCKIVEWKFTSYMYTSYENAFVFLLNKYY